MLGKQEDCSGVSRTVCTESRPGSCVFITRGFIDTAPGYNPSNRLICIERSEYKKATVMVYGALWFDQVNLSSSLYQFLVFLVIYCAYFFDTILQSYGKFNVSVLNLYKQQRD